MSRKVTVDNQVLHKQLDDVIELIPMPDANMQIHNWTKSLLDCLFTRSSSSDISDQAQDTARFRKESFTWVENLALVATENSPFKAIDLHDSNQVLSQWYIPVYEVKSSPEDRIGFGGAFGEVFRGTCLRTPVLIKSFGYDEDLESVSSEMFARELHV